MKKSLMSFEHLGNVATFSRNKNIVTRKFLACFKKDPAAADDAEDDNANGGGFTSLEVKELAKGILKKLKEDSVLKDVPTLIIELKEAQQKITELETKNGKMFDKDSEFGKFKAETNTVLLDVKALLETPRGEDKEAADTFSKRLTAALETKSEEIGTLLKNHKSPGFSLELKDVITESMLATIQAGTSPTQTSLTTNTGFISKIRHRILTYLANVSVGQIAVDLPYAMWIEEFDEEGTAIFIAEGATKTNLSVNYKEQRMRAVKIAVFTKMTTEFLRNLPQLVSFVQNNLLKRLDIATEDGLFNGLGPADEELQGLFTYAVPFTGGGITGVTFVNEVDVLSAVGTQVQKAFHKPTGCFVSLSLMGKLATIKNNIGALVFPVGTDFDNIMLGGMKLIGTAAFENENLVNGARLFIGGDLTVINVAFLENLNIQIGLDGNDFTQNKKTLLLEQILVQFISANDVKGLVTGNFDTAMGLIG